MCSTDRRRIAEIGKAIDDLAAQALVSRVPGPVDPAEPAGAEEADRLLLRLAELWAQLADLDPEVARRLPRYQA
jgi:hypothetical protein